MRFRPRFSLKVLMLFVAAVGIFCSYHLNWIRQRHELLDNIAAERRVIDNEATHGIERKLFYGRTSSFNFLWLFREPRQASVVLVTETRAPYEVHAVINLHRQKLDRAKSLFPEADICIDIYFEPTDIQRRELLMGEPINEATPEADIGHVIDGVKEK